MAHVSSTSFDVVVVGGGIAGLSVVAALAGHMRVCLVEREPILAAQASGRNAAIYRPLEEDATTGALSRRTRAILESLTDQPVIDRCGLILTTSDVARGRAEAARAAQQGVAHALLEDAALYAAEPLLRGGECRSGLLLIEGGVLDIHAIASALERHARHRGARLLTGVSVGRILENHGVVRGVQLSDGNVIGCRYTVIAAGAWSAGLGAAIGAPLSLSPVRRHLVQLSLPAEVRSPGAAVVWRLEQEAYFRREGEGVLASPCDELAFPGEVPREPLPDPDACEWLERRLRAMAPDLALAGAQSRWACFRTFAPDRELVAGLDPRLDGLAWLSGLGGRGMSVGVAAGDLVGRLLLGKADELERAFSVARLLGSHSDRAQA